MFNNPQCFGLIHKVHSICPQSTNPRQISPRIIRLLHNCIETDWIMKQKNQKFKSLNESPTRQANHKTKRVGGIQSIIKSNNKKGSRTFLVRRFRNFINQKIAFVVFLCCRFGIVLWWSCNHSWSLEHFRNFYYCHSAFFGKFEELFCFYCVLGRFRWRWSL